MLIVFIRELEAFVNSSIKRMCALETTPGSSGKCSRLLVYATMFIVLLRVLAETTADNYYAGVTIAYLVRRRSKGEIPQAVRPSIVAVPHHHKNAYINALYDSEPMNTTLTMQVEQPFLVDSTVNKGFGVFTSSRLELSDCELPALLSDRFDTAHFQHFCSDLNQALQMNFFGSTKSVLYVQSMKRREELIEVAIATANVYFMLCSLHWERSIVPSSMLADGAPLVHLVDDI